MRSSVIKAQVQQASQSQCYTDVQAKHCETFTCSKYKQQSKTVPYTKDEGWVKVLSLPEAWAQHHGVIVNGVMRAALR